MTSHIASVPPRLVAPGGPVTRALAVMLHADPDRAEVHALRRAIAMRIEADIALLDALDGDTDEEPGLGAAEPFITEYTLTGRDGCLIHPGDQARWAAGATDDREEENEHGGAVDDQGEPSLGSLCGTAAGIDMPQTGWDRGSPLDNEEEHDGREDDELEDDRSVSLAEFVEIDRRMMEGAR